MTSTISRIDAWCRQGDLRLDDIAWFRVIYSAGLLLTLQPLSALSSHPAEEFDPPPGPIMLFGALPSHAMLEGLEIVTAILAGFLLLGLHTRTVSVLLALALMTGFGLTYSFGKIDHTIVLVLVPAMMVFSRWGGTLSLDAGSKPRDPERGDVAQWPMRLLAVMIALSFVTAGWAKFRSGWLDLDTHAVQGHFARGFFVQSRDGWLAPEVIDLHLGGLWEVADWLTVGLELGLVLTVVSWRWFRLALAVTTLFHLGILLVINIAFSWNLLGYAAFYRWASVLPPTFDLRIRRSLGYVVAAAVGAGMYALHEWAGPGFQHDVRTCMVFLGAAFGLTYIAVQLGRASTGGSPGVRR
jgi:uncharacterized membrane protein YphA (DoxX/SURF4 family)